MPALASGKTAVCGNCKTALTSNRQPPTANRQPATLTDATFGTVIAGGKHVVDFWAAWCGPCRMVGPVIDALASERTDVRFGKLNVDENPRTAAAFQVQSIPLIVFFRDGNEAGRLVGAVPKGQIEAAITRFLGS
ncbi:MAG TPA: thioredoxin [Thermoanaerobaculia bacterium]|nr:thioredoxin [Thermoanaerobaculia bacterium]